MRDLRPTFAAAAVLLLAALTVTSPSVAAAAPATTQAATRTADPPRRVMFLIDGSESMKPHADAVRAEVATAIQSLAPQDRFNIVIHNVIFLHIAMWPGEEPWKRRATRFLGEQLVPAKFRGENGGLPANLSACRDWDVRDVYLLSNGKVTDAAAFALAVRESNVAKCRIHTTLAYAGDDPEATKLLKQIASDSGGTCNGGSVRHAEP